MGQKSKTKNREILIASRAILISFCETQGKSFISTASEYLLEKSERTKIDSDSQQLSEARHTLENPKGLLLKKLDHEIKARFKVTFPTSQSNPKPLCSTNISDDLRLIDEFQMEIMELNQKEFTLNQKVKCFFITDPFLCKNMKIKSKCISLRHVVPSMRTLSELIFLKHHFTITLTSSLALTNIF